MYIWYIVYTVHVPVNVHGAVQYELHFINSAIISYYVAQGKDFGYKYMYMYIMYIHVAMIEPVQERHIL